MTAVEIVVLCFLGAAVAMIGTAMAFSRGPR